MHKLHAIFGSLVHVSGVHGGAEHSARRTKNTGGATISLALNLGTWPFFPVSAPKFHTT